VAAAGLAAAAPRATAGAYALITPYDEPGTQTTVTGINDAGYVTGDITDAQGNGPAFVRDPSGVYQTFVDPPMVTTQAGDINNNNQVTANTLGYYKDAKASTEFLLSPSGAETNIVYPKDGANLHGSPKGINDEGVVVGDYWRNTQGVYFLEGYIEDGSSFTTLDFGANTSARGINDAGVVVGWSEMSPGTAEGFIDDKGATTFLSDPAEGAGGSTFFEDINNHGLIVGEWVGTDGSTHPFEYNTRHDTFLNFKPPTGGPDYSALGINDRNQVVLSNGAGVNYRYDPFAPGVPEPATWTMLLAGFAGMGLALRRRRRSWAMAG
jgi:hypothetical protein